MNSEAVDDLHHAARATKVGAESRESVVDDVRMRVVESGQHSGALQVDHADARTFQAHHRCVSDRDDLAACDRQVALGLEAGATQRPNDSAGEDQVRFHAGLE